MVKFQGIMIYCLDKVNSKKKAKIIEERVD